ncbi:phosphatase [Rudanella paleaurantiibacter]|uniref:Phosphatase n=1 Tax=Rudanella paleaurantiibacter TaxID=2614655 RepID=A0A7J5TUA2_9BACT|nr:phosphatase [Rudanella paleaurantiibacter]KAB7727585.1 phosphatase [Rudanella paleaurantiibacter]
MKQAVIDLGTNTFHLMIVEQTVAQPWTVLFRESRPAKIGKGGIGQNQITDEAIERALTVLTYFRSVLDAHGIDPAQVQAFGTSAIRVAGNQDQFVETVARATGIRIQVISGDQEAAYIYAGVLASGAMNLLPSGDPEPPVSLVMDIGGGSVEFILGTTERIFWKQSFEMGGQRLMDRFMPNPQNAISLAAVERMNDYFREQLLPLVNAIHQYAPTTGRPLQLVGSSGTFDTLIDMQYCHETGHWPDSEQAAFVLPVAEFYRAYELLLTRNHDERMQLPGMIELRVDMIVVAVCLIDYILTTFGIQTITVSRYSLKEGVLAGI